MSPEILIVDDEPDIRMLISGALMDEGFHTRAAADAETAIKAIRSRRPSLVLLDIWLEGSAMDGMAVLDTIRQEHPNVPVVMISGHGNVETAVAAIKKGAYDFIEKPFKTDRLLVVIDRAIEAARLRRENEELKLRAGGKVEMIGATPAMIQVAQTIDKVAATSSRILITGPAGVGKEVVARLIHAASPRASSAFVAVNCAAMRPERMEIELFGAEAGQDGDGSAGKIGTFEQAHGGTLLLDEVADMPLETQGKIVRVLQDQTFERVGGDTAVEVDVRVIASSNRDLRREIAAGRFREDLYYRLNVVPIEVPPLRRRRGDIPKLADHFMATSAARSGVGRRDFSEDAMAALQSYDWPGNVRQLCNVIDWLLIMSPEDEGPITAKMLPPEITGGSTASRWEKGGQLMTLPLREARETFEREYLIAQITRFGGNISRTATFIGMERSALHRKLKTLGVHASDKPGAGAQEFDA